MSSSFLWEIETGERATVREARFQALVEDLLPEVRHRHARYSAEQVLETAVQLAAYRLSEELPTLGASA